MEVRGELRFFAEGLRGFLACCSLANWTFVICVPRISESMTSSLGCQKVFRP